MTSTFEPDSWERVAVELRAQREAQKQAWGDIDNATLGRYLADEVSPEERRHVEQALADRPELRQLTDLVRGVLSEFEPVAGPVPAPVPASPPRTLPFPTPGTRSPGRSKWLGPKIRQRSALAAAACLLLALGLILHGPGNPDAALLVSTNLERAEARKIAPGQEGAALVLTNAMARRQPGEVRTVVVPTLLRGLRQCATAEQRLVHIQALARLGPAAREAVPLLAEVLKRSREPAERQTVVLALGQLGPTADRAVPVLVEATRNACPQVNRSAAAALLNYGPEGLIALRDLKERGEGPQKQLALDTLRQTSPREACVGIEDACELFTVQTVTETHSHLLSLARSGLPVYVETVADPTDKAKDRNAAAVALLSAESVHLRMYLAPLRVEIRVPESLRRSKLTQACQNELRALLERHLNAKEYDQALRAVARFLAEKAGK